MDVSFLIKHRLVELGLEQQDLARAAEVTESYISQLLTRKKAPPSPDRTDIYDKLGTFLRLPNGELAKLADLQRQEQAEAKVDRPTYTVISRSSRVGSSQMQSRQTEPHTGDL